MVSKHEMGTDRLTRTVGEASLADLLSAWDERPPGAPVPPGPPGTAWEGPLVHPGGTPGDARGVVPVARLLRAAWRGPGVHVLPDGRASAVRRRPAPSAGGCYPVQLHALVADGCDLPPGRYVFDTVSGRPRRIGHAEGPAGHALVVLTLLPARTSSKYHHRAWPLWVADTVYALRTLATLADAAGTGHTALIGRARAAQLRGVADLPEDDAWRARWPGSAPETVMCALELSRARPGDRQPRGDARAAHAQGLAAWSCGISSRARPDARPAPLSVTRPSPAPHQVLGGDLLSTDAALDVPLGRLLRRRSPTPVALPADPSVRHEDRGRKGYLRQVRSEVGTPPPATTLDVLSVSDVRRGLRDGELGNDQAWLAAAPRLLRVRHEPARSPHAAADLLNAMWWAAWVGAAVSLAGAARAVGGWTQPPGASEVTLHGVALWDAGRAGVSPVRAGGGTGS